MAGTIVVHNSPSPVVSLPWFDNPQIIAPCIARVSAVRG